MIDAPTAGVAIAALLSGGATITTALIKFAPSRNGKVNGKHPAGYCDLIRPLDTSHKSHMAAGAERWKATNDTLERMERQIEAIRDKLDAK